MKMMGYQIVLRITRFVILVFRPGYQKFCLRSTPESSGSMNRHGKQQSGTDVGGGGDGSGGYFSAAAGQPHTITL